MSYKITSLLLLFVFFLSCTPEQKKTKEVSPVKSDTSPPQLQSISPPDQQKLNPPVTKLTVKGVFQDESKLQKVIFDDNSIKFKQDGNKYNFETEISLQPGENKFLLEAEDIHGNFFKKSLTYYNGEVKTIILEPERKDLPPGGRTFFEVFLNDNGNKIPLSAKNVQFTAKQGYFKGPEYRAPNHSGIDTITAKSIEQNAVGEFKIRIISSTLKGDLKGPDVIQKGQTASYEVVIENAGKLEAVKSKLIVKLPDFVILKSSGNAEYIKALGEVRWDLGNLGPGIDEKINFSVKSLENGQGNISIALESSRDQVFFKSFPVKALGELEIFHKVSPSVVKIEQQLTTTLTITARENVTNLRVRYEIPKECKFISAEAKSSSADSVNANVSGTFINFVTIPALDKGQSFDFNITSLLKRYGDITFKASINHSSAEEIVKEMTVPTK